MNCFILRLFCKEKKNEIKCKEWGVELQNLERLKRHMKKAHGNVPEKKIDPNFERRSGTW